MHDVLPLHAIAEIPRQGQFSTTWIVYALGMALSLALTIGEALYAQLVIFGVAAGDLLRRRWSDPVLLVIAPLAFAVMGGTFVHASQIALALPLAAVLFTRTGGCARVFAGLALAALAVPWLEVRQQITGAPAGGYLYAPAFPTAASSGEFASAAWGRYVWSQDSAVSASLWLLKAPTFVGLLSLFTATVCALTRRPRSSAPA